MNAKILPTPTCSSIKKTQLITINLMGPTVSPHDKNKRKHGLVKKMITRVCNDIVINILNYTYSAWIVFKCKTVNKLISSTLLFTTTTRSKRNSTTSSTRTTVYRHLRKHMSMQTKTRTSTVGSRKRNQLIEPGNLVHRVCPYAGEAGWRAGYAKEQQLFQG